MKKKLKMVKNNEYKESFFNWLSIKTTILGILIASIIVIFIGRWVVMIPYYTHNYMNIGWFGVIIGGVLMFILLNIPLGAIIVIFRLDDDSITNLEVGCIIVSGMATLLTLVNLYLFITL